MLDKRTNILFEEAVWKQLLARAKKEDSSVGELIRRAISQVYFQDNGRSRIVRAIAAIRSLRQSQKNIDYKALIEYGRR